MAQICNRSQRLTASERRAEAIVLRRSGLSLQATADKLGVSYALIQRDIATYMRRLDEQNMAGVAAIRAQEFEELQQASDRLNHQIHQEGEYGRISELVKVSESKRKLYAVDVQPVKKAEVVHRREVAVQLITTLRTELDPHVFGEVLNVLTRSQEFNYLGGSIEGGSETGGPPDRALLNGYSDSQGANQD